MHIKAHREKVEILRHQIHKLAQSGQKASFHYNQSQSNTCHAKNYKAHAQSLDLSSLDQLVEIDPQQRWICVEPRMTMETLLKTTLPYGLAPLVVPEFKGITVGGAIMGGAAESSSHRWGIFHDSCCQVELIDGRGELIVASPLENRDLFYGISGSYGTLALLVSARIALMPIARAVRLKYHSFSNLERALESIYTLRQEADFVDGIIFSHHHAVLVSGQFVDTEPEKEPLRWFVDLVEQGKSSCTMSTFDYFFRYDRGAFWMGKFLFSFPFLRKYLKEGLAKWGPKKPCLTESELKRFHQARYPGSFLCALTRPWMDSQSLWTLFHKAQEWLSDRLIVQDFCIPYENANNFFRDLLEQNTTFPIWICPIKGCNQEQIFAPTYGHEFFLNFGIYGLPSQPLAIDKIIHPMEALTARYGGRKVLYSRSFYTKEQFWEIYPYEKYEHLRTTTHASAIWHDITDKVLK